MNERSQLTDRKNAIAEIVLAADSGDLKLPRPGRSLLLVLVHDSSCRPCGDFLARAAGSAEEIAAWSCDFVVVVCGPASAAPHQLPSLVRVHHDAAGAIQARVRIDCPGVLIADEWRDVVLASAAGPQHEFPAIADLVSEIRYLGIRCSECEGEAL